MPFDPEKFIPQALADIRRTIGREKAICALSGGVDSFTAAALVARAIPGQLYAVYVDTGLMRLGERKQVEAAAKKVGIRLTVLDGNARFFAALKGVLDPEEKRKKIGELFIRLFEEEAQKDKVAFLVQGTIAPDWIESGGGGRETIKSHHNVGGLPEKMHLKLCEPLRELYKHEVRIVGQALGLPEPVFNRQPFPGPALAVRIIGEVTHERVTLLQKATKIVEEEIESAAGKGTIERPWQYFAALLPLRTVGVRGDERAYQQMLAIRAVRSLDGMTASVSALSPELLQRISTRVTNEVHEIGRVLYDVTNKPPGTIEFE